MGYIDFALPSGAVVYVQSSHEPAHQARGSVQASAVEDRTTEAWSDATKSVAEVGAVLIEQLRTAFEGIDEVTAEFGANIGSKMGVVLVEGTVAANLKVTVKWKYPKTA